MFVVGGGNYIEYQNLMDYAKVNGFCLCIRCVLSGFQCTNIVAQLQKNSSLLIGLLFQRHGGAKKLVYGASEVVNASQFLKQVRTLCELV